MKTTISALLLSTLLATSVVYAEPSGKDRHERGQGHYLLHEKVAERLELTDAQREEIRQLTEAHREQYPRDRKNHEEQREDFKALMDAPEFDEAAVREHLAAQTDKRVASMKLEHQIRQLLTDEQRQQLDEMHERMKKKHH